MDLRVFGKCELEDVGCTKGVCSLGADAALGRNGPRGPSPTRILSLRVNRTPSWVKWHMPL